MARAAVGDDGHLVGIGQVLADHQVAVHIQDVGVGQPQAGEFLVGDGLVPLRRGPGGGGKESHLIACVGGDGLAGGNQGVHHGLVPHLGPGHVAQLLQGLGEDGFQAVHVYLVSYRGILLQSVQPGVPQGDGAAAVQRHNRHSRIVQHGLNTPLRLLHRLVDGFCDFRHGQAVVGVAEAGVNLGQLPLRRHDRRAAMLQSGGKFGFCHCIHLLSHVKSVNFVRIRIFLKYKCYICAFILQCSIT